MTTQGLTASDDRLGVVILRRPDAKPLRLRARALTTCETRAGAIRAVVTVWERVGAGLAVSAVITSPRAAEPIECAVKLDSLEDLPGAADQLRLDACFATDAAGAAKAGRRSRTAKIDAVITGLCDRVAREQARRAVVAALGLAAEGLT